MSKHTPGPWTVEPLLEDPELHTIWRGLTGFETLIARTCFAPASEANARLIASAPDLLAALKALMEDDQPETLMQAQAAIAKAEGRLPSGD